MNEQIPNSVSYADLQNYLTRSVDQHEPTVNGKTEEELEAISERLLNQALAEAGGTPAIHKIMALQVLMHLGNWHAEMAEGAAKSGNLEAAGNCMAEYGEVRAAFKLLSNIMVSELDQSSNETEG